MKQQLLEIATDDKTGMATATGTIAVSISTALNWIPDNIGNLGVLMGICLSATLIIVHIRVEIRKTKIDKIKIKHMQREIDKL